MRRRANSKPAVAQPNTPCAELATYNDCLQQADICCEQARAAAQLKRFQAASGLFHAAQNLYQRAIGLGGEACTEARERLAHLTAEIASYGDLATAAWRVPCRQVAPVPVPIRHPER